MSPIFSVGQTPHTLGGLLTLSARLLFRTRPMLRITALVMVPIIVVQAASAVVGWLTAGPFAALAGLLLALAGLLPYLVLPWMDGAIAHRVIEESLGRTERGARGSYGVVRRKWPQLFATSALRRLTAGLMLAIVPGIAQLTMSAYFGDAAYGLSADPLLAAAVLAVCSPFGLVATVLLLRAQIDWSLRAPVIVAEDRGVFAGLQRSAALVRGERWKMLGRLLPLAVLELFFVALPSLPVTIWLTQPDAPSWLAPVGVASLVVGAIGWFFFAGFEAIYLTLNYLDLRVRRENLLGDLAETAVGPVNAPPAAPVLAADSALTAPATPAQRIIALQHRIRHEGESCPLWVDLAAAYREVGDLGAAVSALERARLLPCADPGLLLALAEVHRARRDVAAVQASLRAYVESAPGQSAVADLRKDARWRGLLDFGNTGGGNGA